MKKTYYIDSENVGDAWISLLETVTDDDTILVFYTAKSPHMNYKNLILLKESPKKVTFIECCEGSNALDFQLCTELGFRVHDKADNEFIIVSNDTGYDAVIKYWKKRDVLIKRIKAAECSPKPAKATVLPSPKPEKAEPAPTPMISEKKNPAKEADLKAMEVLYIVGKDNLQDLHTALQQLFGPQKGKTYYNTFKSDPSYNTFLENHIKLSPEEKRIRYCTIVFSLSEPKLEMPKDFPKFVTETWKKKKNLNSFRAALQTKYGKDKYEKYYSLIKAHIKILDNIK